jgi:ABC-type transporter Mla subunit MlaD
MAHGAALAGQMEEEKVVARLAGAAGELERLVARVNAGDGTAGKLVSDPAFHDRVVRLLDDLHASQADLAKLVAAAAKVSDDGAAISAELRKRSEDLPAMLDQTQRLLLRTNQTLEAMQRHWLLRGAVEEPAPRPEPPAVLDRPAPEAAGARP